MCLSAISVAIGAARPSIPHIRGAALLCRAALCPVLGSALAGLFLVWRVVHACSVIFLRKKGITNAYEQFVAVRNAAVFGGVVWTV